MSEAAPPARGLPAAPVRFPLAAGACVRAVLGRAGPAPPGRFTGSGQEALTVALRGLARLTGAGPGARVVVPDFICPSVPAAVRDAGLEPQRVELDPAAWFYEPGPLDAALCGGARLVVLVSYFGLAPLPEGKARESALARLAAVEAVEDCAQAFGEDRPAWLPGSRFRIFSFGPGKSLPLRWGGLVQPLGDEAEAWLRTLPAPDGFGASLASLLDLALAQAQSALLHPALFRFVPLPRSVLAPEPGGPHRASRRPALAWPAQGYLSAARPRLRREIETRRSNALALEAGLRGLRGIVLPARERLAEGVALRLPVLFDDPERGERARQQLQERGILRGPCHWGDYGVASPRAREIADRLLTLPTWSGSERAGAAAIALLRTLFGA